MRQISKAVIIERIPLHTFIKVIPGFFDLTHVKNAGAAFSLFSQLESPFRGILLNSVAIGVFLDSYPPARSDLDRQR